MSAEPELEPEFEDPRGGALAALGVFLGVAVTGALWWNFAGGSVRHWHPGLLGVLLVPVGVVGALVALVRLLRAR